MYVFKMQSRLMFVNVNIPLWEWNADAIGIEPFLDRFGGVKVNTPVIGSFRPNPYGEVDAAIG